MSNSYNADDSASRKIRDAFSALPFDQKISTLIRVELDMLGDAINTVMSAASKAADDIANALGREESKSEPGTSANL
jgi:hypothetical protein